MSSLDLRSAQGLSGEADHRIANSLSVISSLVRVKASRANGMQDAQRFLLEIADRIETVAVLHRQVAHSQGDEIAIGRYLKALADNFSAALASTGTCFTVSCPQEQTVPFKVAMAAGLIVGELFSNSVKYAHPSGLPVLASLSCEPQSGGLLLLYRDDGVGFPEHFDFSTDGNLGLRLIKSLSTQMNAIPNWSSSPLGIEFRLFCQLDCAEIEAPEQSAQQS
jgi:two-component sensor histidine kinase